MYHRRNLPFIVLTLLAFLLAGCLEGVVPTPDKTADKNSGGTGEHLVGGLVTGLRTGGSVQLVINNERMTVVNSDGAFNFSTYFGSKTPYKITIRKQPLNQTCTVKNGSGVIGNQDVQDVLVECADKTSVLTKYYSIGGQVSGLTGQLGLTNNGFDKITVSSDGSFTFLVRVTSGDKYSVDIHSQPSGQTCALQNGYGTVVDQDISNIQLLCTDNTSPTGPTDYYVGGQVSGLNGTLELTVNGTDPLTITGDGIFQFNKKFITNSGYLVEVSQQPAAQTCTVTNHNGVINNADISDVQVACSDYPQLGGKVHGASGPLTLLNNGVTTLAVSSNGVFNFSQRPAPGSTYEVTVQSSPTGQSCIVRNGTGSVGFTDVSDVDILCADRAQLSSKYDHGCAIADNALTCWGKAQGSSLPALDMPLLVSTGDDHNCVVDKQGVGCWGSGATTLLRMSIISPLDLASGQSHSCAMNETNVECWGDNSFQQLNVPTVNNPVALVSGANHSCVLDSNGVQCWGDDSAGQSSGMPVLSNVQSLVAGENHTCAIDDAGLHCWGDDTSGQSSVPSTMVSASKVWAGHNHTCAESSGSVACWGGGHDLATTYTASASMLLEGGDGQSCLLNDSGVNCWGNTFTTLGSPVPSLIGPNQVAVGRHHACAMDKTGVICWGDNSNGQTNSPSFGASPPSSLQLIAGTSMSISLDGWGAGMLQYDWIASIAGVNVVFDTTASQNVTLTANSNVTASSSLTIKNLTTGQIFPVPLEVAPYFITGVNNNNVLILNRATGQRTVTVTAAGSVNWMLNGLSMTEMVSSTSNTITLKPLNMGTSTLDFMDQNGTTGTIEIRNDISQMNAANNGDEFCINVHDKVSCWVPSDITPTSFPFPAPAMLNPDHVSVGFGFACAKDDNGIVCWGSNGSYQIDVPPLTNVTQVSAGETNTCAIDGGVVKCWGAGGVDIHGLTSIPTLSNPALVAAGDDTNCAIDVNGLSCWGNLTTQDASIAITSNTSQLDVGYMYVCAATGDGVRCYEKSNFGARYDFSLGARPYQIGIGDNVVCALGENGVKCWDLSGSPITVPALSNPTQLAVSKFKTCVLHDAGLTCWRNGTTQLQTYVPNMSWEVPSSMHMTPGQQLTVQLKGLLLERNSFNWSSSNTTMVDVVGDSDASYIATLTAPTGVSGKVDITVKYNNGTSIVSKLFTVHVDELNVTGVNNSDQIVVSGNTGKRHVSVNEPNAVATPSFDWASNNPVLIESKVGANSVLRPAPRQTGGTKLTVSDLVNGYARNINVLPDRRFVASYKNGNFVATPGTVKIFGGNATGFAYYDATWADASAYSHNVRQIVVGDYHHCFLDDNGAHCVSLSYGSMPLLSNPTQLASGANHACAIDDSGVQCWGDNTYHQTDVPATLVNPRYIAASYNTSCAIDDNGMHCWGFSSEITGGKVYVSTPTQVAPGYQFACALGDAGVACWGDNSYGQLDVPKLSHPVQIATGAYHACALDDTGVVCWGKNANGQLAVPSLSNPTAVSAGHAHSCALDGDNLVCWGKGLGHWSDPLL